MKLFSVERANALIPRVAPLVDELLRKRRDLAIKLLENRAAGGVSQAGGVSLVAPRLAEPRSPFPPLRFGDLKGDIIKLIQRIESYGCILKDIDLGLLDFPSRREDESIYLCWKAGEAEITYWHRTDEGLSARKPLSE
jgi:hypothetical protein